MLGGHRDRGKELGDSLPVIFLLILDLFLRWCRPVFILKWF